MLKLFRGALSKCSLKGFSQSVLSKCLLKVLSQSVPPKCPSGSSKCLSVTPIWVSTKCRCSIISCNRWSWHKVKPRCIELMNNTAVFFAHCLPSELVGTCDYSCSPRTADPHGWTFHPLWLQGPLLLAWLCLGFFKCMCISKCRVLSKCMVISKCMLLFQNFSPESEMVGPLAGSA